MDQNTNPVDYVMAPGVSAQQEPSQVHPASQLNCVSSPRYTGKFVAKEIGRHPVGSMYKANHSETHFKTASSIEESSSHTSSGEKPIKLFPSFKIPKAADKIEKSTQAKDTYNTKFHRAGEQHDSKPETNPFTNPRQTTTHSIPKSNLLLPFPATPTIPPPSTFPPPPPFEDPGYDSASSTDIPSPPVPPNQSSAPNSLNHSSSSRTATAEGSNVNESEGLQEFTSALLASQASRETAKMKRKQAEEEERAKRKKKSAGVGTGTEKEKVQAGQQEVGGQEEEELLAFGRRMREGALARAERRRLGKGDVRDK